MGSRFRTGPRRPLLTLLERSLEAMEAIGHRLHPETRPTHAQRQGLRGERAAYFYLRRQGYIVTARRWRHAMLDGEVDLIGWEGERLCLIEVKSRDSRTPFAAEMSVDAPKQEALRRMVRAYIRQLPWPPGQRPDLVPRFDVVSVYLDGHGDDDVRLLRDFFR